MTDDQIYQLVAQGGIGVAALGILGKIALKVADRMILAIDSLAKDARETGKANVEALGLVTQRLARLEGKVEVLGDASGVDEWPEDETSEVHRTRERRSAPAVERASERPGEYAILKPTRR